MIRTLLLVIAFCASFSVFCQKITLINSGDVINKGVAAYDSGNYEEAIKTFLTITPRDTNYSLMLAELSLAYNGAKQYDKTIETCDEGLKTPSPNRVMFLKSKAIALDRKGEYQKSVALFEESIKRYPTDQNLVYNLGITHFNNKEYEKAKDCFFRSLSINPFHSGSHINLGKISMNEGRKVHAMLSYGLYVTINDKDNATLVHLNNLLANEVQDEGSVTASGPNAFEKLDQVIRAKVAMDKNFKTTIPVDAAIVKQFEMLFQQLDAYDKGVDDPWIEFYLPIYKSFAGKLLEPFVYHILSSSSIETVHKWRKKNEKSLKAFYEVANVEIRSKRAKPRIAPGSGIPSDLPGWYNDDNKLTAFGKQDSKGNKTGSWIFFYTNGERSAQGTFSGDGKKSGVWKYYNSSGETTSIENEDTGEITTYYNTGEKSHHYFLKNGKADGEVNIWYRCGNQKEKLFYKNGFIHGKGEIYFVNGQKSSVYNYLEGKLSGEYTTYYENGTLKSRYHNKDGKAQGPYVEYHVNGKVAKSGNYLDDELDGVWMYYYANGKLNRTGTYRKSLGEGEWLFYDEKGRLNEKRTLKEGEYDGLNTHFHNGKPYLVNTYAKDKLIKIVHYDQRGKVIGESGDPKGYFAAKGYFPTGELKSEGQLRDGEMTGKWTYYYRHGKVASEYTYEKGLIQGPSMTYFHSGAVKVKSTYKDNELHGYFQEFYEHGPLKYEGWFQHGEHQQQFLSYQPDGKVKSDYYYLNDKVVGTSFDYFEGKQFSTTRYDNAHIEDMKQFDPAGTLLTMVINEGPKRIFETKRPGKQTQSRFEVLCGQFSGEVSRWYTDGSPFFSYQLLGDRRHGKYVYYYPQGKPEIEGQYIDGNLEGEWRGYSAEGKLDYVGFYLNDNIDSVWTYYYANGKVSSSGEFFRDQRDGITKLYGPDGSPLVERQYIEGDLVAYRVMTKNGQWSDWAPTNGNAKIQSYYSNGNPGIHEEFKDNFLSGKRSIYYPDGKIYSEFNYINGDYHGTFVVYFPNGKPQRQGTYEHDELHGLVKHYNDDGSLLKTEEYVYGQRSGKVTLYKKGAKSTEIKFWGGVPYE